MCLPTRSRARNSSRSKGLLAVIGASVESADNILAVVLAGDQQNVLIARASLGANAAAQFRSIDFRHHPVEDQQFRGLFLLQNVPGSSTVFHDHNFMTPSLKPALKDTAKHGIVLCYQDAQG